MFPNANSSQFQPIEDTKSNHLDGSVVTLLQSLSNSSLTSSPASPNYSCEDLATSQTSLSLVDKMQLIRPSPETILMFEMLQEFPDLKTFVCHSDFMTLAILWLDYKRKTMLAHKLTHRQAIMAWLKSTAAQIHYHLISIAKSGNRTDPEALGMFSAFRRLKDRMEIVYQVFVIIENGRVLFGQTPTEAIAPLVGIAHSIRKDMALFARNPHVIPFLHQGYVELRPLHQVTMQELSKRVLQTYHIPSEIMIQPSMLHSWSLPSTPCALSVSRKPFFSLPASPKDTLLTDESDASSLESSPDDEDYVASEDEEEAVQKKTRKVIKKARPERPYARRTATSYDAKTTHYLKTIFFEIYSHRGKLNKDQRRQIQKKTGLKPRNITYWFSNHKRRFQNSLAVFKQVVKESQGKVKTYDDFLNWRKEQGLPEEISEDEVVNAKPIEE